MSQLDGFMPVSEILRGGVYALVYRHEVVYVGKSKEMLTRVYSHRQVWRAKRRKGGVPSWVKTEGILFDEVHIMPVAPDRIDEVERQMIERYAPKYNTMLKPPAALPPLTVRVHGKVVTLGLARPTAPCPLPRISL